ncbi:hypothetical protein QQF64_008680 [Cirrhinus molitorella]|uniref:Uncharacterized protein n=1 Tax=Cirrhinus molitorella TaxID=172907 RepID=A0ABR3MAY9_9TELE
MRVWTPSHFGSRQPFVQQPAPVACLPAMQLPHTRVQRDRSRELQLLIRDPPLFLFFSFSCYNYKPSFSLRGHC